MGSGQSAVCCTWVQLSHQFRVSRPLDYLDFCIRLICLLMRELHRIENVIEDGNGKLSGVV